MTFNSIFELLDYIYLIYFTYPELDRDFADFCEDLDIDIDYNDGLEGILNDLYRILSEQYESDFFDETPELYEFYIQNFEKITEIVMNFHGKFEEAPYQLIHFPEDGETVYSSWKAYLRQTGHELEQNHYIGGMHPQNLHSLIFYISNNLWEFNFSPIIADRYEAIHQAFDEYLNPYIGHGRDYMQMIKDLIEEQLNNINLPSEIFDKIIQKIQNHQSLSAIEKYVLKYTNKPAIIRFIEEILPKNHEIVLFLQKTVEIPRSNSLVIWL